MHIKYKLLVFLPLFLLIGCNNKNKCIVKQVSDNKIYVRDIHTGTTKVLVMNTRWDHLTYVLPKDTIDFFANNGVYKQSAVVQIPQDGHLLLNGDSLQVRQHRYYYHKQIKTR